jgi:drug/metabolite transporter (DMT)-like permease
LATQIKQSETFLSEGVRAMLLSTFFFALMNVFIKLVPEIPAMEIVFFRCLVSMLICFIGIRRARVDWLGNSRLLLFLRGAFGTSALYLFFITLQNVPLASSVTISYLSPIFTTIIAVFILKERVYALQWAFFVVSLIGVFVMKGFDTRIPPVYFATGIASGFFSALAYNMVRSLKGKEHPLVVVLHFQLVGVVVGFVATLFNFRLPNVYELVLLIGIGLATHLGQVYLTKALQAEKIAKVSILNYLGIIYALVFGWLIFGETYTLQTALGILLVTAGVAGSVVYSRRKADLEEEIAKTNA